MRAIARDREERYPSLNMLIAALEPFATPALYDAPLKAFPERSAETATLNLAQGLTTTPAHDTPAPGSGGRLPSPSPLPQVTTHRERGRLFVRGALAMLPVVALGLALVVWSATPEEAPERMPAAPQAEPPTLPPRELPAAALPRMDLAVVPSVEPELHDAGVPEEARRLRPRARGVARTTHAVLQAWTAPRPMRQFRPRPGTHPRTRTCPSSARCIARDA